MGQKTHPIGIRLGINRQSFSKWYAKKGQYAFFVNEDHHIRSYVLQKCRSCIISNIEIDRRGLRIRLCISAAQVRALIGIDGSALTILRKQLKQECQYVRHSYYKRFGAWTNDLKIRDGIDIQIFVRKITQPESEASCLADFIVLELEKRTPFRRIMRIAQERAQNLGKVRGVRVQVTGRLNGAEIARTEWIRRGQVPLHTLSANLDYTNKTAHTIYGLLGVKVWLFRPKTCES
jgi:small subunit ribosomal protein S3